MPYSFGTGRSEMIKWAIENNLTTILDVGPGAGVYSDDFFNAGFHPEKIDAVEVFEPYIEMFELQEKYDNIYVQDILTFENFNYDLIILGDIIEHLKREDAIDLWNKISKQAKYAFIKMPIGICTQENLFSHPVTQELMVNDYERHLEPENSMEDILSNFSHIFKYGYFEEPPINGPDGNKMKLNFGTGVFYAKFKD